MDSSVVGKARVIYPNSSCIGIMSISCEIWDRWWHRWWLGAVRQQAITWVKCWPRFMSPYALQWCHNGRNSISNHQPYDCLLNHLFRRRSKKTSKFRVAGLWPVNSPHKWPVTQKMFPFDDVIMGVTKPQWVNNPSIITTPMLSTTIPDHCGSMPAGLYKKGKSMNGWWLWCRMADIEVI